MLVKQLIFGLRIIKNFLYERMKKMMNLTVIGMGYVGLANATEGKENINITYSFQKKMTDTVAASLDNEPFILENGEILYRPGDHGALIENLNDLEADIIFIKNIDNVCHRSQVEETIE